MAAHVCRQGGYKATTDSIMMFSYIELLYIQLYHDSSYTCMSTGGYKAATVSIMKF